MGDFVAVKWIARLEAQAIACTQAGQLEPSGGVLTLGLTRQVADTADSLTSPVLQAVGEIERFYQERYKE